MTEYCSTAWRPLCFVLSTPLCSSVCFGGSMQDFSSPTRDWIHAPLRWEQWKPESWLLDCQRSPYLLMDGCCFPTYFEGLGSEETIFVNAVSFFSWKCGRLRAERVIHSVCDLAAGVEAKRLATEASQHFRSGLTCYSRGLLCAVMVSHGWAVSCWGQLGSGSIQPPLLNNRGTLDKALWFS